MRHLLLLILVAALFGSLRADDPSDATPKERIATHLQQLRAANGHLLDMCTNATLVVPPSVIAMYDGRCSEAEAMLARLQGGTVPEAEVTILEGRLQRCIDGMTALSGFIQATDTHAITDQYKHVAPAPELVQLQSYVKATVPTVMKALAAQGELEAAVTQAIEMEHQRHDLRLKLADSRLEAEEAYKDIPGATLPAAFTAGCKRLNELLGQVVQPPPTDAAKVQEMQERTQMRLDACKAIVGYLQDLLHADVLTHTWANAKPRQPELTAVEKDVAAAGTVAAAAMSQALTTAIAATSDAKLGPGVLDRISGANDALITPVHDTFDRDEETWDALDQAEDSAKDAATQIARCLSVQAALKTRFVQALTDMEAASRSRLAAAAAHDRVAGFEAKGGLGLAQVALDHIRDEAQLEGDLDEASQPWAGHEKDPKLAETLKAYGEKREKLRAAQAVVLADALNSERLRARLELLDFRKQLLDGLSQTHTQDRDTSKDGIDGAAQAVLDALQGGPANRDRDARDAQRIPIKAPGDDKF
jgi:hypothetical protein